MVGFIRYLFTLKNSKRNINPKVMMLVARQISKLHKNPQEGNRILGTNLNVRYSNNSK